MEENNIKKPLIEIDNELIEMSKNVKIINSLKDDIDNLISNKNDNNNNNNKSNIEEKYNKIKSQIQKFMNKKKFIYNYIDNEKLVKKNISSNIIDNNAEEENEKLIEDKNKYESALENINKMQKKITILANDLDKKISELNLIEKKEELIEEIKKNEVESNNLLNNQKLEYKSSILDIKAQIYNEQTKDLEKANKMINEIKMGTNEMKIISDSQGYTINNIKNEHNNIGMNIEKGIKELNINKASNQSNNSNTIKFILLIIFIILVFAFAIYYKSKHRR